jgi:hypothetical protein
LVFVALAACGRSGFDSTVELLDATNDIDSIAFEIDAPLACPVGDGVCLYGCANEDTDCATTCGDGICVGNAGEMCNSCATDCKTMSIACGNGACEAGESPNCYADCGPPLWKWGAEEAQLIGLINSKRTAGYKCPGAPGGAVTRPAYVLDPTMLAGAREWSWEIAHQNYWDASGVSCNDRTPAQRELTGNYRDYIAAYGFVDVAATFNDWITTSNLCQLIMSDMYTNINVGVSYDINKGYVFVLK